MVGYMCSVSLQIVRSDKHKLDITVVIAHLSGNSRLVSVIDVVPLYIVNPVLERSATQCSTDVYFSSERDP